MLKRCNFSLYILVLLLAVAMVITAMGGGLFGQSRPWFLQWQHQLFAGLCHQMPSRSFWLNGQPMAVCSRCLGIYSGFLLGWVMLPLGPYVDVTSFYHPKKMLLAFFLLNSIDVLGNWFGFWHNTLVSRLLLGGLMGYAAAQLFTGAFFKSIQTTKHGYYGAISRSKTG